jgi:hypothetical protein
MAGDQSSPRCLTVNVCPAIVSVPNRSSSSSFFVTLNVTLPFPVPLVPESTVIQPALLPAVQEHPGPADTATVLLPALSDKVTLVGLIEYEQTRAACVTVNVWPAMVMVPVRALPTFATTLNPTEPLPVPLAPAVTMIQFALLLAVHVQPAPADTATFPVPPRTAIAAELGLIE